MNISHADTNFKQYKEYIYINDLSNGDSREILNQNRFNYVRIIQFGVYDFTSHFTLNFTRTNEKINILPSSSIDHTHKFKIEKNELLTITYKNYSKIKTNINSLVLELGWDQSLTL